MTSPASVDRVNTGTDPAAGLRGRPLRDLKRVRTDPESEFIVGSFRHADRHRAVLIVNDSYAYTAWPTVEWMHLSARCWRWTNPAADFDPPWTTDPESLPDFNFKAWVTDAFVLPAAP